MLWVFFVVVLNLSSGSVALVVLVLVLKKRSVMGASNLLHSILLTQPRVRHPTGCLLEWSHAHCPNFTLFLGGEGWRHASETT
jgi:hypothetical protein